MKVLVISHNAFAKHHNMGQTLLSLFASFEKSEICQLYVYPTIPEIKECNSYYRVTDKDVLKGVLKRKNIGKEIFVSDNMQNKYSIFEDEKDMNLYLKSNNGKPIIRLARDLMWKLSPWFNKNLEKWIEREKPTCIFLAPGYAKFIYDIAIRISEKYKLPIVTYICDDYYFVKTPKGLIAKIQLSLLKKKIENLLNKSRYIIAISDEIRDLYKEKFNISAATIMTGRNTNIIAKDNFSKRPTTISYFGNVWYNRYVSLCKIGEALNHINESRNSKYKLKIYTSETSKEIVDKFNGVESIELCGFVMGDEFDKALRFSDFLLHVEGFDDKSIDLVKNSISTKIADSLSSGIPLIAYGPSNIASIGHLSRHNCAYILGDDLETDLINLFEGECSLEQIVNNALLVADQFHDKVKNSNFLRKIMKESNE